MCKVTDFVLHKGRTIPSDSNPLIYHVRNDKRVPIATIIVDKEGRLGLSVCSDREKMFNKKKGISIAVNRLLAGSSVCLYNKETAPLILDGIKKMEDRASRYFKNDKYKIIPDFIPAMP